MLIDVGFILGGMLDPSGSQIDPWERMDVMQSGWWGVQDGAGIVLVHFLFRLAVWGRFVDPLGLMLGSLVVLLGRFGVLLGLCGISWGRVATK